MNENNIRREKIVYSATPNSRSDLVTGMGEKQTKEDMWEKIKELLDMGHWATNRQLQIWVRGFATDRYSTIEELLAQKVKRGELREDHYGKPKVYARPMKTRGAPKKYRPYLYHEFSSMECYIRFQISKKGTGIPQRDFEGVGVIPDFGIQYETTILLGEFETEGDINHHKRMEGKLAAYDANIEGIEDRFGRRPLVVFVLDVPRWEVQRRVANWKPEAYYRFIDYKTLTGITYNMALDIRYIWPDGSERPLRNAKP